MVTIALTGANGDVGYNTVRKLAALAEVTKMVITCRTKEKCENTVARLAADTGKDLSFFSYIVLEVDKLESVMAAAEQFPLVDRLCLNAGGLGECKIHGPSGATDAVVSNVLGHAVLTDKLFESGKIKAGGRIVYVGSEVTRRVWSFKGFLPDYLWFAEKDIDWAISTTYNADCGPCQPLCCPPIRQQMGDYKNAKIVGQLFYAAVAKERPEVHTIIISPGGVGGSFGNGLFCPAGYLIRNCSGLFRCMCVMQTMDVGVQRMVDVLSGEPEWESGAMPMSPANCGCCLWGFMGSPMVDNRDLIPYMRDESLYAPAAASIRKFQKTWTSAASPHQMSREKYSLH